MNICKQLPNTLKIQIVDTNGAQGGCETRGFSVVFSAVVDVIKKKKLKLTETKQIQVEKIL